MDGPAGRICGTLINPPITGHFSSWFNALVSTTAEVREDSVLTLLVLAPSFAFSAVAVSAQIDPPTVRQSRNGEFMTKYYPPTARSRGEQGKVGFQITIDDDGFMTSCEVTASSGFKNLDRETCDFLIKYGKVKPARDSSGRTIATTQQGYMNWKLPPGSPRMAMADTSTSLSCTPGSSAVTVTSSPSSLTDTAGNVV